jgi:hypothetical protein
MLPCLSRKALGSIYMLPCDVRCVQIALKLADIGMVAEGREVSTRGLGVAFAAEWEKTWKE